MKDLDFDADKGEPFPSFFSAIRCVSFLFCFSTLVKSILLIPFLALAKEFLSNFADADGAAKYMNILVSVFD